MEADKLHLFDTVLHLVLQCNLFRKIRLILQLRDNKDVLLARQLILIAADTWTTSGLPEGCENYRSVFKLRYHAALSGAGFNLRTFACKVGTGATASTLFRCSLLEYVPMDSGNFTDARSPGSDFKLRKTCCSYCSRCFRRCSRTLWTFMEDRAAIFKGRVALWTGRKHWNLELKAFQDHEIFTVVQMPRCSWPEQKELYSIDTWASIFILYFILWLLIVSDTKYQAFRLSLRYGQLP